MDKQGIYEVVCRFARGADRPDRELMRSSLHPNALHRHVNNDGAVEGAFAARGRPGSEAFVVDLDMDCASPTLR
ncbi:MAG: hypothetical protein Q8M88_15640 [Phenylobacterium sp.]|uniref:hypothetical protein n=1 Tax=Phenylobacterium sp. TaxID=1871053 RepID=UPI002733606C|nr:hypothetical protein [Phenylobacterium sp.]MDP3175861.1 hypothetical protein [Phenylobacterium sp.]